MSHTHTKKTDLNFHEIAFVTRIPKKQSLISLICYEANNYYIKISNIIISQKIIPYYFPLAHQLLEEGGIVENKQQEKKRRFKVYFMLLILTNAILKGEKLSRLCALSLGGIVFQESVDERELKMTGIT